MFKLAHDGSKEAVSLKDVFAQTLEQLIRQDPDVVYVDADLMNSFGTLQLSKTFPDRCIDCGVQEANMVGLAAGLSAVGKKPYVHSFGTFASRRCFDQAFLSVGYAGNSVRIFGSDPGVMAAYNGGTHMPFEDIALYRCVPGAAVIDIADAVQLREVMKLTKDRQGLTYIRTPRKNAVKVYSDDSSFELGKANVLRKGGDAVIIACGIMTAEALCVADMLAQEGIRTSVVDMFCIKPLDEETVLHLARETGAVVTAENANIIGGLGGAVCELLSRKLPTPVESIGAKDRYGQVGPDEFLRQEYEMTAQDIAFAVEAVLKRK